MNIQEFAALKPGDKIENTYSKSIGEIVDTSDSGVHVIWGQRHDNERKFFYSVVGTSWMHWSKVP